MISLLSLAFRLIVKQYEFFGWDCERSNTTFKLVVVQHRLKKRVFDVISHVDLSYQNAIYQGMFLMLISTTNDHIKGIGINGNHYFESRERTIQ